MDFVMSSVPIGGNLTQFNQLYLSELDMNLGFDTSASRTTAMAYWAFL